MLVRKARARAGKTSAFDLEGSRGCRGCRIWPDGLLCELVLTSLRNGAGNLEITTWRAHSNGTIDRLDTAKSAAQRGGAGSFHEVDLSFGYFVR
jgi:hypothetical protein